MPSQGNYFTNLLNQEVVDVFDSGDNVEVDHNLSESPIVNSQPKQKGRSKNFVEKHDRKQRKIGRPVTIDSLSLSKTSLTKR
jgi:hypothetical protein